MYFLKERQKKNCPKSSDQFVYIYKFRAHGLKRENSNILCAEHKLLNSRYNVAEIDETWENFARKI